MSEQGQALSSWKEISAYLGRTVRTCQRLEATMGLPVHRLDGSPKAHVFAYPHELDAWLTGKVNERSLHRKRRRLGRSLLWALAVFGAGIVFMLSFRDRLPAPRDSVAVLPFTDLSPDRSLAYQADGIAEDVRVALMQVPGLGVPCRDSLAAVRGLDARKAAELLRVKHLLGGTVRQVGDNFRITVWLSLAKTGYQVWADGYDHTSGDLGDLGGRIAAAVASELRFPLKSGEKARALTRPSRDAEAYELYLRGRNLIGETKAVAQAEALSWFQKALARDPNFALAYAGIAWVHMNRITLIIERPAEAGPQAEEAVRRALAIDPDLAEAQAMNAWVRFLYGFDWEAAQTSFRKALNLKPGDALTRGMYAYFLVTQRRFEESRAEIRQALASDPLVPLLSAYYVWIHLFTGHYQEVLDELGRIERLGGVSEPTTYGAGVVYLRQGRIAKSIEMFEKARALPFTIRRSEAGLAVAYARQGDRKRAEEIYGRLREERKSNLGVSAVFLAWVAAALGDFEGALGWLDEAIAEHDHNLVSIQIQAEAYLPEFAREPRFLERLDRLGLPH